MEGSEDSAAAGNNCLTSYEQHSSTENTAGQLTLQPEVSSVEGSSVLADTLNQLLHTPMDLGQNMNILDDPTCLIQSTLDVDKSLLASLDSGATVGTNLTTTEQVKPELGERETASGSIAPIPSSGDCNNEKAFFVPSDTSASELTELNVSQLASSIIDSAAMSASIAPLAGAFAGDSGSSFVGLDTELGMSGNIIDQISPPMELPDLNLVMAEGMAAANDVKEEKTTVSQQRPVSDVSTPMIIASPQTSTISLASEQNPSSTANIPLVSDAQFTSAESHTATHQHTLPATPIPTHAVSTESVPLMSSSSPSTDQVHVATLTAAVPSTVATQTPPSAILTSSSVAPSTPATVPTIFPSTPATPLKMTSTLSSTESPLTTLSQSSVASTSGFPPPSAVTHISSSAATASHSTSSQTPSLSSGASTSQSATAAAASTFAKGLNLPLLQFLHLNFPSLKIKDLQEVLNINSLLTQVLKQQLNQVDSMATPQQQTTQAKVSQQVTVPRVVAPKSNTTASGAGPLQLATSSLTKTMDTHSKSNVLPSTSMSNVLSATASRSATQTGLFVPSSPLGALTKQQAPCSQITSVGTSTSLANVFSEVKAMPARPVRADGQPVLPQAQAGSSLGINVDQLSKQNSSLVSTLSSPTNSAPSSPSSSPNTNSRKAVLVQILNKSSADPLSVNSSSLSSTPLTTSGTSPRNPILVPRTTPLSKSPLILNRHGRTQQLQVPRTSTPPLHGLLSDQSTPTSLVTKSGTPVSSLCVSLSLPALKNLPDSRRKRKTPLHVSGTSLDELHRTVVQPAESEAMEVDVGEPIQRLELPKHLKDHSYCIYNPEEGEKQLANIDRSSVSSIPPARLSYAPQVPDSPSTLHKLLKVLPKKNARQSLAITPPPRSSFSRNHSGRTNKSRGNRKGNNRGSKMRGKSIGKKVGGMSSGLLAGSDDESRGSSSEFSDTDEPSDKNRRRSQRNAGQRKRYVDDLNIPISDDELMEDVMSTRPPRKKDYKGYGKQEDSDFEGWGAGGEGEVGAKDKLSVKHKSRTISINPTEGFQYSDVYFEPPAEEANLVERILSHRVRDTENDAERQVHGDSLEEFFVKYKNYSYLHAEWATFDKLLRGDRRFDGKVKRYKAKQASLGIFSNVEDEPFNPEYTEVDRCLDVATQTEPNGEVVTHYLVKWRSLPYEDATWELEEDVDGDSIATFNKRQMLPSAKELGFIPRPPPASFRPLKDSREYKDANFLRSYQKEGLNWLVFNWYARQNCILADEMGLGKTVQSITFLIEVFNAGIRGPFLVIVPLSTISNWQREFETWSDFNVVIYHGSAYSRRLIHEYDLYFRDSRGKIIPDAFKFNAIVTTYEVMLSDDSELQNIDWRVVIIDEAHRLKNRNCKLLEGLKRLSMEHRVLLTGTPLQNSVEELFSLLNFLEPHTFPSHVAFLQQFGDLKTEEQVEELKAILKPMMLRRLKEDVEKSIASKEETIIEVELTSIQKQYYRAILERNFMFLSKGSSAPTTAIPSLLNVMMELRKCCNHPFLIKGAEQKIVTDWQAQRPTEPVQNSLVQASGKLVLIDKLLPKLKDSGHKVLIFSQMVRCLDIMEDYLRMKGYFYERIDGQVRGTLRQEAIDRFSKPDSDRFVFLLCTRAGGLGINLTAADTVIIYDSDWNPQNDIQAQARCHRIGQNKPVKVYRLITRNSYEREMFDRASLKLGLDKAVLHSVTTSQQAAGPPQLSKKEIEELLKKGAYGALMEGNDDDANRFCEEDIDQILEQRAHVVQLESEGQGSTFSKASFVADESSDINIDDPDFWQKWAEKAKLDLDELANKDNLVLDTPRQRRQVRRYGNDQLQEEIVDMIDPREDVIPSRGRHGWTKIELFKTEKWMLIYGWGQWRDVLRACDFRKRQLGVGDVENISRTILIYCLAHFKGDEKIPPYIHRLIDPSEVTETGSDAESQYSHFTEDDYLALLSKNPETLFQDESYMKHLRRHAHKIIFRIRQLHIIRWQMLVSHKKQIMKGTPAKSLGLQLPKPEETAPALWWNAECDNSLIVGILKHGYEQFHLFRADPALCFKALVGEEPPANRKKKKVKPVTMKVRGEEEDEFEDLDLSGEDTDDESAPSTPGLSSRLTNSRKTRNIATNTIYTPSKPGMFFWPSLADVNTRARRLVSAWVKNQKREEQKQLHLMKERVKREKEAEVCRRKELKKAELAQKWSKREEQDFARVVTFFGVIFDPKANKYDWTKFRQLASLTKKSDERLTLYLHDFQQMCRRVIKKKPIRRGLTGIRVEPVIEERAIRCLQRIELLSSVRLEILPHPDFDMLIELCEQSFEVPSWWIPASHDRDLLKGVAKHGLYRSDQLIYNDPELSFKQTVPQTALFDPETNQVAAFPEDEESGSEDEDGPKLRSTIPPGCKPVPLGWPKEKAIAIRITRIAYAFRNRVWPKPMEGLDLFNPTISDESSEDSSLSDMDSDYVISDSEFEVVTTRSKKKGSLTVHISTVMGREKNVGAGTDSGDRMIDVIEEEKRDFEIEKQQGLKMTLKKSSHIPLSTKSKGTPSLKKTLVKKAPEAVTKLEIKIPLVKLSFASKTGLKKIPKKRPAERGASNANESPDSKRHKTQSSTSSGIDPTKINFTDLTGHERVGVINRNTNERLPLKQSPMLKNLKLWLEGHPHFNVDPKWGSLVIEWGALKPDMYHRVLLGEPSEHDSNSML